MNINFTQFLLETDILAEHLIYKDAGVPSFLQIIMQRGTCFTTALNASEILFCAQNKGEKKSIIHLLNSLKILNVNSKYTLSIPDYIDKVESSRDALICTIAEINKLPIVTSHVEKFLLSGLTVLHPKVLRG